ncbi:MAG: hypothetical protein HETSPECPRED_002159 [Heterodermia speciosa]|uniref:Uncharacterized protein n=1 Tax=Heterodermia speciosa TaxID=116794 RepID=A0A8H3PGZ8_9LECA|nr:MAG: hypothetical protein HETSPECPRED_002159 [Heterodermia speciosa]
MKAGCENDFADNVLVSPKGTEYVCTNTELQPDDTPELSTCPITKANLYSGVWGLGTFSNNGDGKPIAYKREISLSVGPQATTTYTPTVTLPKTVTPIINATSTSTFTSTTVLPPVFVTSPSATLKPTVTVTPLPVTTTKTLTLVTLTKYEPTLSVTTSTSVVTATCITPTKQESPDPTATISPTAIVAAAFEAAPTGAKFRRNVDRKAALEKERGLRERAEHFVHKRAPGKVARGYRCGPLLMRR